MRRMKTTPISFENILLLLIFRVFNNSWCKCECYLYFIFHVREQVQLLSWACNYNYTICWMPMVNHVYFGHAISTEIYTIWRARLNFLNERIFVLFQRRSTFFAVICSYSQHIWKKMNTLLLWWISRIANMNIHLLQTLWHLYSLAHVPSLYLWHKDKADFEPFFHPVVNC